MLVSLNLLNIISGDIILFKIKKRQSFMSGSKTADQAKERPKILWLEDDLRLVNLLKEEFEALYEVENIQRYSDLQKKSRYDFDSYEAVLLDMELSDGKLGFRVIEYLKALGVEVPILVLTNDESFETKISTLKLGVEDYLWKAMHPEEMLLRLSNAIARYDFKKDKNRISLAGVEILPWKFLVTLNQDEIQLTKIELIFLANMIKNHPNMLTCDYLREKVWRMPQVEVGTINTFIWKLNKKLNSWTYRISKDQDFVFLVGKVPK
jgi:DNA-binding response OmpR family regulator